MSNPVNRKERRAVKASARHTEKAVKAASTEFARRKEVNAAFQTLSKNFENLVETYNTNTRSVHTAFQMTDAHLFVTRRVLNDMAFGQVRPTPLHPYDVAFLESNPSLEAERSHVFLRTGDQEIDMEWYHRQYHGAVHFGMLVAILKNAVEALPKEERTDTYEFQNGMMT